MNIFNVKHMKLRRNVVSLLTILSIIITCFVPITALADSIVSGVDIYTSSGLICADPSETAGSSSATVKTGEAFIIKPSASFSATEVTQYDVRLYISNMDHITLTYFNNGGEVGETRTVDGITYTVKDDNDGSGRYISITGYDTDGTTFAVPINAYFKMDTPNGISSDIRLVIKNTSDNSTVEKKVTLTASSQASMKTTKNVSPSAMTLDKRNDETVLSQDIVYTVSAFSGEAVDTSWKRLENGEAAIGEYTITDTLTLPDGMEYMSSSWQDIFEMSFTPESVVINGNTATIKYKVTSDSTDMQIRDFIGTIKLKKEAVKVNSDASNSSKQIQNTAVTNYSIYNGKKNIETETATASTIVQRPAEGEVSEFFKSVSYIKGNYISSGQYSMYEGDIAVFKISYKNSGQTTLAPQTITDTLPDGLVLLTEEEAVAAGIGSPVSGEPQLSSYFLSGSSITINTPEIAAGSYCDVYVAAKVSGNVERTITNKAELNGIISEATVYQKEKSPKISIDKYAVKTDSSGNDLGSTGVYETGGNIKYYINIENTGAEDLTDVSFTDYFPYKQLEVQSAEVVYTSKGAVCGEITKGDVTDNGEQLYNANITSLPAGGKITVAITAKDIQNESLSNITNTAVAKKDNISAEDSCVLAPESSSSTEAKIAISKQLLTDHNVKAGDKVTYRIVLNNIPAGEYINGTKLKILDMLPEWLSFDANSVSVTLQAWWEDQNNPAMVSVDQAGQLLTFNYSGNSCGGTIIIQYDCMVNEKASISDELVFRNQAIVEGGSTGIADSITTAEKQEGEAVSETGLKVSKQAYVTRDNVQYNIDDIDGVIRQGEEITFKIIIENTNTTDDGDITDFILTENMLGDYMISASYDYGIGISVVQDECSGVEFKKDYSGNYDPGNECHYSGKIMMYPDQLLDYYSHGSGTFSQIKPIDIRFTNERVSYNTQAVYSNSGFKLKHGGKLVLEYKAVPAETFTIGSNSVSVDGSAESRVDYMMLSGLSITKNSSIDGSNNWRNPTEYIWDTDAQIDDGRIYYKVSIKNETSVPYTSNVYKADNGTYLVDELPEGTILNGSGTVYLNGEKIDNVKFYGGNSYTDVSWEEISDNNSQAYKSIAVFIGEQITIGGGQSLDIYYDVKLSDELKTALKSELASEGTYRSAELANSVYFHGDNKFEVYNAGRNTGIISDTITDSNTVIVRSSAIQPGIKKEAYGYFAPQSSSIIENSSGTDLAPGAYLIWKITVYNGGSDGGKTMKDYTVTDTVPEGYVFAAGKNNSQNVSYPSSLSDELLKTGAVVKVDSNGNRTSLAKLDPATDNNKVTWTFNGDQYALQPGEHIEFTMLTIPENEDSTTSGIYRNVATLTASDKIYKERVYAGVYEDGSITDDASFALNSIATASEKVIVGDIGEDGTVQYKLTVKNESSSDDITNLCIIDKLPYLNDTGVLTEQKRGSQCGVEFVSVDKIIVAGSDMTDIDSRVSYAAVSDVVFAPADSDWNGENGRVTWKNDENSKSSAKLVRINIGNLSKNTTAEIYLTVKILPDISLKTNTVYNTFGYCYDGNNAQNMAAEAAKIGADYTAAVDSGVLKVKKVYADYTGEEKTFYFTVYDGLYNEGGNIIETKPITLTGDTLGRPVSSEILFDNLQYPTVVGAKYSYYIYETDANGIPIKQSDELGYTMNTGFYRIDIPDSVYTPVANGEYCMIKRDLSLNRKESSATFSNLNLPKNASAEVTHVFYADVPTDNNSNSFSSEMISGYKEYENGTLKSEVIKDNKADLDVNYEYSSGGDTLIKNVIGDGWGGNQGHTVSTGFLAKIKGGNIPTPFNMINWKINTLNKGSYMRLTEGEFDELTSYEIQLSPVFTDGDTGTKIYQVQSEQSIEIDLQDPMPYITLAADSTAYIGIIVDGIYDKDAFATIELDAEYSQEKVSNTLSAALEADNAEYVKVKSPIQTGAFRNPEGAIAVITAENANSWTEFSKTFSAIESFSGKLKQSVRSDDGYLAIYASSAKNVTLGNDKAHGDYISVGSIGSPGTSQMSGCVALNLNEGCTIKVKAASGSAEKARGMVIYDETGRNSCIETTESMYGTPSSLNLTSYDGKVDQEAFWMKSTEPKEFTATVKTGGMVCIASANSGIRIYSIEIIPSSSVQ